MTTPAPLPANYGPGDAFTAADEDAVEEAINEDTAAIAAVVPFGSMMSPPKGVTFPNLTVTVDGNAPSYTAAKNIAYTAWAGKVRVGGVLSDYFGNGQNSINGSGDADFPGWTSYEIEFIVSGQYCSIYCYDVTRSDFQILVDDVQWVPQWAVFPTDATAYHIKFDFGTGGPATHRIRALMPGNLVIQSIWLPGASDIWAAPPRPRMFVTGDSYVQGPTSTNEGAIYGGNICGQLALRTGWEVWNMGQGGTGPASAGTGSGCSAYGSTSRLAAYAALPEMDAMMVYGAANDDNLDTAVSVNASKALWTAMKLQRPSTPLIVVGPEPGSPTGFNASGLDTLNAAMKAAAAASTDVTLYIDQRTNEWVTGTGNAGATKGDGSADFFISSDGIHPTHAGFANIVERILLLLRRVHV